jgi:hypothetical protein
VFQNSEFRDFLLKGIKDEQLSDADTEARNVNSGDLMMQNVAPYITSKFSRMLQDTLLRRIVGHGAMALNFREIMDSGRVVIIKQNPWFRPAVFAMGSQRTRRRK